MHLDGGLVGVPAIVLGLHHSVALEEHVLALEALSLVLEGPLSEGLNLLADLELLLLGISLGSLISEELGVLLLREALGNVGALVLN